MKKMLAIVLSGGGAVLSLWAAFILLSGTGQTIYGYNSVYAGLAGLATLTAGLVLLSNS